MAAQGLGRRRPVNADRAALRRTVRRIGLFQVDSVNVFARAHEMPMFSRCGPYDPALLTGAVEGRSPLLHETWAHVASLVDIELEPALRYRRRDAAREAWRSMVDLLDENPRLVDEVIGRLADGPATARQISGGERGTSPEEWGWNWSASKTALEWAWRCGRVAVAGRTASFEKIYALPDRVLPARIRALPEPGAEQGQRELAVRAATALGVFTPADLADYFRTRRRPTDAALSTLASEGLVEPVTVDGEQGWWMCSGASVPRRIEGCTVVSPFDPVVFRRERALRLHALDYRIEIYVPRARRRFGYYCLPFLLGQDFVARVDLRADRAAGVLEVASAWREPGAEESPDLPGRRTVATALAGHLEEVAEWRGLDRIRVLGAGDLAPDLARAMG
ncbi:winged helix-turn-helix domain-containing protein [Acidipropionibacterium acidipropionici]|uniref:winged helix-turn-helix domain-containing protein n=1 Tax=Acidipropionibacterium acidipropionici TaxID=1748 RepID=UPI0022773CAD|nr:crosslink repair DNA glycosylase YcaQ family protein [Acidipropionibacterium acidipropionici]